MAVQRQACMAIRNAAVRCVLLRWPGASCGAQYRQFPSPHLFPCSCLQTCHVPLCSRCRSPEVRAALLDKGVEALLRQVKSTYPSCAEAGSTALRDLGLENYNG